MSADETRCMVCVAKARGLINPRTLMPRGFRRRVKAQPQLTVQDEHDPRVVAAMERMMTEGGDEDGIRNRVELRGRADHVRGRARPRTPRAPRGSRT
jgi:hypothetical protein